ncbi:hypothetical protein E2C01_033527 [Portunus trituberculatus]|uniref:Uncharacterized protein n=1 Tax=Portunus trituberculatus TaxID=210409 RepID=A0A5B7F5Q8_PORTR|nr:hypothetical protein [Portunus trituberculatus]
MAVWPAVPGRWESFPLKSRVALSPKCSDLRARNLAQAVGGAAGGEAGAACLTEPCSREIAGDCHPSPCVARVAGRCRPVPHGGSRPPQASVMLGLHLVLPC